MNNYSDIDYQWPSKKIRPPKIYTISNNEKHNKLELEIQEYFSNLYGAPALLLPSGRSALSLALKLFGADRRKLVFAPKFSSHCVWNIVGRYSNPTIHLLNDVDIVIAVHKFGIEYRRRDSNAGQIVIEDSCDSIIIDKKSLFINSGQCEIFSLPKIMGVYGGGIMVFANQKLADDAKYLANYESSMLNESQGRLRWELATQTSSLNSNILWDACEYENFKADYNLLHHIKENIKKLDLNRQTISRRIDEAQHLFPSRTLKTIESRLPPLVAIEKNYSELHLMRRHINKSNFLEDNNFVNMTLLPLHFGVSDEMFSAILSGINNQR